MMRAGRRIATGALLGLPAALLGLPAALLAHTLVFNGTHEAGGSAHAVLYALAGAIAFLAALAAALIATQRMREVAPRFLPILCGACSWFAAIEAFERDRGVPVAVALLALTVCSWIVRAVLRAFSKTVIAVVCTLWCAIAKLPQICSSAIELATPALQRPAYRFRIFSRPPPLLS